MCAWSGGDGFTRALHSEGCAHPTAPDADVRSYGAAQTEAANTILIHPHDSLPPSLHLGRAALYFKIFIAPEGKLGAGETPHIFLFIRFIRPNQSGVTNCEEETKSPLKAPRKAASLEKKQPLRGSSAARVAVSAGYHIGIEAHPLKSCTEQTSKKENIDLNA